MVRFRDPYTGSSQPDLVQLGFLMVDTSDWKIRNQGSFLVQLRNATAGIEESAEKVHGISAQDCSDFGVDHDIALDVFENLCSRADVLVGHNIRFDAIVMQTAFFRGGRESTASSGIFASKQQICTMMESIELCKLPSKMPGKKSTSYKWPSLEEAYRFVNGDEEKVLEGAHDALVDSEACLQVFRYLVEHGHVSVEKRSTASPDATAQIPATAAATFLPDGESPTESLDESATAPPPVTKSSPPVAKSSTPAVSPNIEASYTSGGVREYDASDRNGDIDRSREIEEETAYSEYSAEHNNGIDRSREIEDMAAQSFDAIEHGGDPEPSNRAETAAELSARLFDPAEFSPERFEAGRTNNSSINNNNKTNRSSSIAKSGGFRVRGNTYPHKEMIKQLGGQWNREGKYWVFFEERHLSKLESFDDLTIDRFSYEKPDR
jgi:DNA polymerase III epsilon subunit-like protein